MITVSFLLILVVVSFAAPIAEPTFISTSYENVLTAPAQYGTTACVIGRFMVTAGGGGENGPIPNINVIDIPTGTRVGSGNLSSARSRSGLARFGENQCLVVGGAGPSNNASAELITINATSGEILTVENITNFPTNDGTAWGGICLTLPDNTTWCTGFASNEGTSNISATWNGTQWIIIIVPVAFSAEAYGPNAGSCVLWGTDVWCCGGVITNVEAPDFCQVIDLNTLSWSNFTVSPRIYGAVSLVPHPIQRLVLYGGYNSSNTDSQTIDVISKGSNNDTYQLETYHNVSKFSAYSNFAAAISTLAIQVGFINNGGYSDGTLYALNFRNGTPVPLSPRTGSSILFDLENDYLTKWTGSWGAVYKNRVIVCGGRNPTSDRLQSACNAWDLICRGTCESGYDTWVETPDYCGCDMVTCHKNFYGPNCTASDCNGHGCFDGYDGNGTCICTTDTWGPHCNNTCNCGNRGTCYDGADGTGTCICTTGTWGPYCNNTCNCGTSGRCLDGAEGTGECICAPGTYSVAGADSNCSGTCDCGTGGICNDGNYGNGACVCERNYYGSRCVQCPNCTSQQRCDDGSNGTGACIQIGNCNGGFYASPASATSIFVGLMVVCFSLFVF